MREMPYIEPYRIDGRRDGGRNIMIMLNYLKNGLVVI